ncbi:MAG: hypothetical protein C4581_00540 [Nitrospiraceae bacterium]|nr:MAG: hypothetical protein C4581_00540 [Nitrospiraceae bacterium]
MELYKKSAYQKQVFARTQSLGETMRGNPRIFSRGTMISLTAALLLTQSVFSWAADTAKDVQGDVSDTAKAGIVETGDRAEISYLCRLKSGEVVAASGSVPDEQSKSGIFVTRKETGPLSVVAVRPDEPFPLRPEEPFDEAVLERLARAVAGMQEGERRQLEITALESSAKDEEYYILRMARVRTRPKVMTMPVDEYADRTGKSPEVGQSFSIDPSFPGRVTAVTGGKVTVRFNATPGDVIQTPFGLGRIYHDEKNYKLDIKARKGSLVRSGPLVGRITDVTDEIITINYRHPFGGEKLFCDVTVDKAEHAKLAASGMGK